MIHPCYFLKDTVIFTPYFFFLIRYLYLFNTESLYNGYHSAGIKQNLMCRGNNLYTENVYFTYVLYDLNEKQQQQNAW